MCVLLILLMDRQGPCYYFSAPDTVGLLSPRGNQMFGLEATGLTKWRQMKFADLPLSESENFPFSYGPID